MCKSRDQIGCGGHGGGAQKNPNQTRHNGNNGGGQRSPDQIGHDRHGGWTQKNLNQTKCGGGGWKAPPPPHFEVLKWRIFTKVVKK